MGVLKINKKKKDFLEFLEALKNKYTINEVTVDFDGSGDSGEIEDPTATNKKGEEIEFTDEERNTLIEFFDQYLEATGYDWYNNDGGYGTMTLNLNTGDITGELSERYTETREYSLDSDEFTKKYEI